MPALKGRVSRTLKRGSAFAKQVQRFQPSAEARLDQVRRASILELFSAVITSTPVDTGQLRANWVTSVNRPAPKATTTVSTGDPLTRLVQTQLGTLHDSVWLVNHMPYAYRVEYEGWSYRAPQGMVRINVARWDTIVKRKAKHYA